MELCPHCGSVAAISVEAIADVLTDNQKRLVVTLCCGKPVTLLPIKTIKIIKSVAACSFDDYGNPFKKVTQDE